MKRILIVIMFLLIAGQDSITTSACAAERAGNPAAEDMKKQHQTMLTVGAQWNKATQSQARKIDAVIGALQKITELKISRYTTQGETLMIDVAKEIEEELQLAEQKTPKRRVL